MDLEFTEEQEMLREMLRGVLAEHCPIEVVRAMEDDPTGYPAELWKQLGEVGILGLLIPEEYGGSGMGMIEGAIVYEELGRSLAPIPHFTSCVLSAGALLDAGSEAQKKEWLPRLASGDAIIVPAWLEPGNGFGPKGVQLRAKKEGEGYVLDGVKRHAYFGSAADRLLVPVRTGEGLEDVTLLLVDPTAQGVTLTQQMSISSDTQYKVELSGVKVPASARVGEENGGWKTWSRAMHDGIILLAAQAVGGSERCLEMTCEYAKEREQFDKPLAAFQSISHYLADAATQTTGAQTLAYEAAWARSEGRDIARLAPMAKLFACQTYRDLTAMSLQVYGGVGFTIEYDPQLYFRRAKQLQISWWDTAYLEELIATDVLD